jgi:transcriptional regulator with XRE-family HTH domain
MGKPQLDKPKRMGEKVRAIRLKLGLTQQEMFELLVAHGAKIHVGYVGLYEINERIPTLLVTLAYARSAGISTDYLIDDKMELPG